PISIPRRNIEGADQDRGLTTADRIKMADRLSNSYEKQATIDEAAHPDPTDPQHGRWRKEHPKDQWIREQMDRAQRLAEQTKPQKSADSRVAVVSPDGKVGPTPASKLQAALAAGYTQQ